MTDAAWRLKIVDHAKIYIGVKEEPAGSNLGPLHAPYAHIIEKWQRWAAGVTGYPWCSAFVCGVIREVTNLVVPTPRRASVEYFELWAQSVGAIVNRPLRGDIVCYDWNADNWYDHIGFVDRVLALRWLGARFVGTIRTVEGNTSAGNDSNGGQVQIRYRNAPRCKFIRLNPRLLEEIA